jgi:transposase, IS5 family
VGLRIETSHFPEVAFSIALRFISVSAWAYVDSGYLGAEARDSAIIRNKNGKRIKYRIYRRPSQLKKLSTSGQYAAKKVEHGKSSVRAKVEHVFGAVKGLFGYRKTRYRGIMKQTAKLNMMFALANLYLADRPCLAA